MSQTRTQQRPNFLIVMADDLGYSDLGCYGSEIATPHLDQLAMRGIRMNSFYCAPFCSPSRAMMLTGLDAHLVGFGALQEVMDPRQAGKPGYEMYLNDRAPTLAERLRDSGYRTYLSGKWHLGRDAEHGPQARGFDRSYGLIDGSSAHFDQTATGSNDPSITPLATYREDGQLIDLPTAGFYSSQAYADKMIGYLAEHDASSAPFFAMLAFTAPHFPLHAPDEYIARYEGRYAVGYDAIRRARHARQLELGLVDPAREPYDGHPRWPKWDTLPPAIRELEARNMAVYAGMVECMDHHVGRVLAALEQRGQRDNTVIVFLSDNGPEGNSVLDTLRTRDWIRAKMDNRLENRGRPGSFIEQGPGWAQVSSTPHRMYKSFTYDGGIKVPCIVSCPQRVGAGRIVDAFAHITDLAPTFLQMAGVAQETTYKGKPVPTLQGRSMLHCWTEGGDEIHPLDHVTGWEMQGRYALRAGSWKLVHTNRPWGSGGWELYDLADDPGETRDLAEARVDTVSALLRAWDAYVVKHNVICADDMADNLLYSNACRYYEDLARDLPQREAQP
ncbi:arylsulfatase [Paraburkholderia antibiotica]|uniref:Arylsulfatase n=1 Tax=Paraburkholderia antibiotica TaxID=2728839 RepID=A0A7X9X2I4_9BURK|nr:arylsulfatase [Paraburkholderia antibiotica]NML30228.1 arylsulfatase [Paraburkholderia antibiotica]